mmetsp:Transcript_78172/g.246998  ORF Transcript_78172/g.246998 Transcript_78172/m.246998 type:complete len:354 (+) Transcript_78172:19-1080(+)
MEGSGADRCVVVTLEKRRGGMWPGLWLGSEEASRPPGGGGGGCSKQGCADPSHDHGRSAAAGPPGPSRAEHRFGIHSFVFQRRRPFSGKRLEALLKAWPTPRKELFTLEELQPSPSCGAGAGTCEAVLRPILRSKGFCWVDSEPLRRHVWAHAGKTLSVKPGDWWWAALDKEQLSFKVSYPGVEAEYKLARREKWDRGTGDRRQELVFIGGPQMREADIVPLLEECLLSEEEFQAFQDKNWGLKVPNDEFHVNGLLKNLGATEGQIRELNQRAEKSREEERQRRKQDREDTDFLRTLGVGSALEPDEAGEAGAQPEAAPAEEEAAPPPSGMDVGPPPLEPVSAALPKTFEAID